MKAHVLSVRNGSNLPLRNFPCLILDTIPYIVYNIPMYSVKEASQKLGLDPSQIRRLLAEGEIKGKKLGHDWVVLSLDYKRKRKPKTRKEVRDDQSRIG